MLRNAQECYQNLTLAASADNGKPQTSLRNLPLTGEGGGSLLSKAGLVFENQVFPIKTGRSPRQSHTGVGKLDWQNGMIVHSTNWS